MPRWLYENKIPVDHEDPRRRIFDVFKEGIGGQFAVQLSHFDPVNPGNFIGKHYHGVMWELYYILTGEGEMLLRDIDTGNTARFAMQGGSRVIVPPRVSHEFRASTMVTLLIAATGHQGPHDTFPAPAE